MSLRASLSTNLTVQMEHILYPSISRIGGLAKRVYKKHARLLSKTSRRLLIVLLLWGLYQLTLGKGSLIDMHLDSVHSAGHFVRQQIVAPYDKSHVVNGIYIPSDAVELKNGEYDAAIARVANTMQLADDGQRHDIVQQASQFQQRTGALSPAQIAQLHTSQEAIDDKHVIVANLAAFLQPRGIDLAPVPQGLSVEELRNLYRALVSQVGALPTHAIADSVNGGRMQILVDDDGSMAKELYSSGAVVGSTYRDATHTTLTLHYIPKHNYPLLGMGEFEGTVAHELGHALNIDLSATNAAYAVTANAQSFQVPAAGSVPVFLRTAVWERVAGVPQYQSFYAQSKQDEDVAETTRAVLTGDLYAPDHVRAFESPLGVKKLQILVELEYRFPGISAHLTQK